MNANAPLVVSYDPLGYIDTGIRMENYGCLAVSRAQAIIAPERTADRDAYFRFGGVGRGAGVGRGRGVGDEFTNLNEPIRVCQSLGVVVSG